MEAPPPSVDPVEDVINRYHVSRRGGFNCVYRDEWGSREKSMANPWSSDNPDGVVLLRLAENSLMHEQIAEFFHKQIQLLPADHLTYSIGPRGSLRLRGALAAILNDKFHARVTVTPDDLCVTPGLASCIDSVAWATCNPNDVILVPTPYYSGFTVHVTHRSGVKLVGVDYSDVPGYSGLDDLFLPEINTKALEIAVQKAKQNGLTVGALMITQPNNPLGRCYPPETMKAFLAFCSRHQIHLISDEIYAQSVYQNPDMPNATPFTSVLSLDWQGVIDPVMVHVMWGASKDFCANGLRLGMLYTKNKGVLGAISSNGQFAWSPHVMQDVWAAMLEDREWLEAFFAKNHELMARNYAIAASFFREHQIEYSESNAGLFMWIDLRRFLLPKSLRDKAEYGDLKVTSPNADTYRAREARVAAICMENKVFVSPGALYAASEYGWFRITFTLAEDALIEGLRRIGKALETVGDW